MAFLLVHPRHRAHIYVSAASIHNEYFPSIETCFICSCIVPFVIGIASHGSGCSRIFSIDLKILVYVCLEQAAIATHQLYRIAGFSKGAFTQNCAADVS
jgi:hypothetical protein